MKTANDLLNKLVRDGGAIVSSGECSEMEISDARARGDFYVDDNSMGYVLRHKEWLARVKRLNEAASANGDTASQ